MSDGTADAIEAEKDALKALRRGVCVALAEAHRAKDAARDRIAGLRARRDGLDARIADLEGADGPTPRGPARRDRSGAALVLYADDRAQVRVEVPDATVPDLLGRLRDWAARLARSGPPPDVPDLAPRSGPPSGRGGSLRARLRGRATDPAPTP